jgi:glycosyltransferase involved in cell wall biosynthesis
VKILILSSYAFSLVNFRGKLLSAMVETGHEVTAGGPDEDVEVINRLNEMGVTYVQTPMARTGSNPFSDLRTLWSYVSLIRRVRPNIVLSYTQKPIIYGGIASRLVGEARFYALMSGLGYVFSPDANGRTLLRAIVRRLYRAGVCKAKAIFVFNSDDRGEMIVQGIVGPEQKVVQVPGSGVDVTSFCQIAVPKDGPIFLMVARLMRDKGLMEFVEAARTLKIQWPEARCHLLGRMDTDNPTGISADEVARWAEEGIIQYLGETRDVRPFLASSSVFVLPSYYREGLPRTILEAMATGRAVITTDMPGCREPIVEGQNGFLVPARNSVALANAMLRFKSDPDLAVRMGKTARLMAEDRFDVDKVNAQIMFEMELNALQVRVPMKSPTSAAHPNALARG